MLPGLSRSCYLDWFNLFQDYFNSHQGTCHSLLSSKLWWMWAWVWHAQSKGVLVRKADVSSYTVTSMRLWGGIILNTWLRQFVGALPLPCTWLRQLVGALPLPRQVVCNRILCKGTAQFSQMTWEKQCVNLSSRPLIMKEKNTLF